MEIKSICVYCGSRDGADPAYLKDAIRIGSLLGQKGIQLIYGGARIGLMGAVADAALENGGKVIGVIPEELIRNFEVSHQGLTQLIPVNSMHTRKKCMADMADAFITLPGGVGSMDEHFEMMTWFHLRLHKKPMGLLNTGGFYNHLLSFVNHAVDQKFIDTPVRDHLIIRESPDDLVQSLLSK